MLGVTVLTSMDSNELSEIGCQPNVGHQVERLASLAAQAGLRGLVCSPLEIADLRQIIPREIEIGHARDPFRQRQGRRSKSAP